MTSAGADSHVIRCSCGRLGIGEPPDLEQFGWGSISLRKGGRVSWLCPKCAGRCVSLLSTIASR